MGKRGTWIAVLLLAVALLLQPLQSFAWDGRVKEADPEAENAFQYLDAFGNTHTAIFNPAAREREIDIDCIRHKAAEFAYEGDPYYTIRRGVDVSQWTGSIDWEKVKSGGYSFMFARIGYSGAKGRCYADKRGMTNVTAAKKAGLDAGVYFFSLAVNESEARKEAEWVIRKLDGTALELPVMYDAEHTLNKKQRNDDLSGEQFTKNAVAFCETIEAAGYEAGIYTNMIFECSLYDITQLQDYHIWFADYEPKPQSPYYFEYLQYNGNGGKVPGIATRRIDLNVQFIPTEEGRQRERMREEVRTTGRCTLEDGSVFDAEWYVSTYPDVRDYGTTGVQYLDHYLKYGISEGRYGSEEALEEAAAGKTPAAEIPVTEVPAAEELETEVPAADLAG